MPIANIFSSYWSFIHNISESYRTELEWDENRTQKRKSNRLPLIKRWDFSSMSILKPQNSISWVGSIKNKIMLVFCNITNKHELLLLSSKGSLKVKHNPNQTHVCCVCRQMAKLCSYILYKSISLRNVIKDKHHSRKGVQNLTLEFYRYLKNHISNMGVNIF